MIGKILGYYEIRRAVSVLFAVLALVGTDLLTTARAGGRERSEQNEVAKSRPSHDEHQSAPLDRGCQGRLAAPESRSSHRAPRRPRPRLPTA